MMGCESADMLFIRHRGGVVKTIRLQIWFCESSDNETEMKDLLGCCLSLLHSKFYMAQNAESFGLELDLELRQQCKGR